MHIDYFLNIFSENTKKKAIIWRDDEFDYGWLLKRHYYWKKNIEKNSIKKGEVVIIEADFSPNSIALLFALIELNTIIVPITKSVKSKRDEFINIAQGNIIININSEDEVIFSRLNQSSNHKYYLKLRALDHPGLVLFSSGSTGKNKASVHDLTYLLNKFKVQRFTYRTVTFLLYDHIGGFNTLLYTLSNGGVIVTLKERSPNYVLSIIEKYKIELLPTSPTFLNLILMSEEYKNFNLDSLKIITYGTEPMPAITLKRFNKLFPKIKFTQTYGLSEVGILRSKSKNSNSLWVKIGGEDYKTRIVNSMLEIKSKSSMIGYLNHDNPFTKDGWFKTGDTVETNGEYIKILGRKSEIINVGGEKVYPQEVENTIMEFPNIEQVTVFSEKNLIIGNIVCANIKLRETVKDKESLIKEIKLFCNSKMANYKTPIKVNIIDENSFYNARFKKRRSS